VVGKFERAQGMGDTLDRIGLTMGEIVGRVDVPGIARTRMMRIENPVEDGITHIDIA